MWIFEKAELDSVDTDEFNSFGDKLIFQTKEWLSFVAQAQNAAPVVVRISEDEKFIGYFTGLLFKKFGINIIGSPFRGWSTSYMGFNLKDGVERAAVIMPLWDFLKREYRCVYCEIIDRFITEEQAKNAGLSFNFQCSYCLDIGGSEEELLGSFTKHCRKQIRQSAKKDITIVRADPDDEFAQEYYSQLVSVFGYQGLAPSYDLRRVKLLLKNLADAGCLLCQRAVTGGGKCVGTNISFGYNGRCYTWGSTSIRGENCDYLQSEALRWEMMRYWRERGCFDYDMVGRRDYKLKFNPYEIAVPRIILTRYKLLITLRDSAEKLYWRFNRIKNKIKKD